MVVGVNCVLLIETAVEAVKGFLMANSTEYLTQPDEAGEIETDRYAHTHFTTHAHTHTHFTHTHTHTHTLPHPHSRYKINTISTHNKQSTYTSTYAPHPKTHTYTHRPCININIKI